MNPVQQRFIIFCAFVALIIGGAAFFIGRSLTGTSTEVDLNAKSKNIQAAEKGPTLVERLGVDDGASIAIAYGADMQGSLETCGWKLHPQGGLARRAKYVEAFKEKYKDTIPLLHVDIGHLFSEDLAANKPETLRDDVLVMNQWILKAFSQFKLDAVNFGFRDLLYGKVVLEKGKYDAQVKETPMLGEMISANIIPAVDLNRNVALKPYVIREVTGKRFGSKTSLKVGFIGVSEPWPGGNTGFVINDPVEKVKAILPEVRSKSDLVVVLAYCSLGVSREIIKQNPDIDVLIAGNAVPLPPPAQREGKTIFVYSVQQTKSLGELRLYLDSDCKVKDYLNRYILLDTAIPDQAEAAKVVANAKAEIDVVKAKIAASEQAELELLRKNPEQNPGQTPVQNATGQPKSPVNPPKGKQNSAVKNEF